MVIPSYVADARSYTQTSTSATDIWSSWNETTSAVTWSVTKRIWHIWNTSGATTVTASYPTHSTITATAADMAVINNTNYIWEVWNDAKTLRAMARTAVPLARKEPSAAQRAEWKRQDDEQALAFKKLQLAAAEASRKAQVILAENLTREQREDLEKKGCFYLETVGRDGNRRKYRIDRGTHGNVKLMAPDGRILGRYCAQPNGVPTEDAMLAQKLWLETNEEAFLKVANFTGMV